MNIDLCDHGGYLPDRPFFPLFLGNGVDGMLINMLGSGDAWWEACTYAGPLPLQASAGWFKSDRRTRREVDLVYGILIPLLEFAAAPVLAGDQVVPSDSRQWFDPRTATLTTCYEQRDNRSLEWLRVCVTTFLCDDHVLVEHYEVLEAPSQGAAIRFHLNAPSEAYLRLYQPSLTLDEVGLEVDDQQSLMRYRFAHETLRGEAVSWFDRPAQAPSQQTLRGGRFVYGSLQTAALHKGDAFTRYLMVLDNDDDVDYQAQLDNTLNHCRQHGYEPRRGDHVKRWGDYFNTCSVRLPDAAMQFLYDVSRYVMRANLHPSGYLPMGLLPHLWQGVMFWDTGFAVQAMLGCGNHAEARRVLEHLQTYEPEARALAQRHCSSGARLEWTVERHHMTPYPNLVEQVHNNAWWAHIIFSFFDQTADRPFLVGQIDWMEQLLIYLVDHWIEPRGQCLVVRQCEGVDESIQDPKTNDTWTCAILLKGLMNYRDALTTLRRPSRIERLDQVIAGLCQGLDLNVDADGVMQSFCGGTLPHWGSLVFDLFPEHPALQPTLAKLMENRDPRTGWYNLHGLTRYAEKAFPWADCWAARIFSRVGDDRVLPLLQGVIPLCNGFAGLPERVFYHGERFNPWFMTAHAAFVWAMNGMLANVVGDTLRIMAGLTQRWPDISFANIGTDAGLRLSATLSAGKLTWLEVCNLQDQPRTVSLVVDDQPAGRHLLQPGINKLVKMR